MEAALFRSECILGRLFYERVVGVLATVVAVVYIGGFARSWGPVTLVFLAQMLPNSIESKALPIAVVPNGSLSGSPGRSRFWAATRG
jgi:hypothetical protein